MACCCCGRRKCKERIGTVLEQIYLRYSRNNFDENEGIQIDDDESSMKKEQDTATKRAEFDLKVSENTIRYSIFDNGGQKVFRGIQHLLFSRNGVYVVIFNLTDFVSNNNNLRQDHSLEHLRYWVSSIKMDATSEQDNATYPPIVLVGTHFDKIKDQAECDDSLKKINSLLIENFESLGVIQTSKESIPCAYRCLYNANEGLCFWPVDNTDPNDSNIKNLRRIIVQVTNDLYNRLANLLTTIWRNGYSPDHQPMFLPSACNLCLGREHPFALVLHEEIGTITVMTSSIVIMNAILPHVNDACKSLVADIYMGRLTVMLPPDEDNADDGDHLKRDAFRNDTEFSPEYHDLQDVNDEIELSVKKLASFLAEKNTRIDMKKAEDLAVMIVNADSFINRFELINLYYSCDNSKMKCCLKLVFPN